MTQREINETALVEIKKLVAILHVDDLTDADIRLLAFVITRLGEFE